MNRKLNTRNLLVGLYLLFVFFVLCACFEAAESTKEKFEDYRFGSSVVFPVSGNVYPLGYYFVLLHIGNPPKLFDLDIDTGSDLTWVQCDAPCTGCTKPRTHQYKPKRNTLPCSHMLCSGLDLPQSRPCANPEDQCDYEIGYADNASSIGALVIDEFPLRLANGSIVHPQLTFGCGYDQQHPGPHPPPPTAGVLGLGRGKIGMAMQLNSMGVTKNVITHCLSHKGGGFLSIGDELLPSSGVVWTSLSRNAPDKNYMVGPAELLYNGKSISVKGLNLVFDSGSSYTYFNKKAYQAILDLINKDLDGKPLTETKEDKSLSVCWKGVKPVKSVLDVAKYFKTLTLQFGTGKNAQPFQIPPVSYLIITKYGNVCLGILNGTEVGLHGYNIIGDNFFQGMMVIYDNEKHRVGWVPANCDRLPKF
ncbi:PREDICTED: aspartic proteinase Asp1 isoform X2 [Tarenaya hassleriana]|uniref:aspartic proteinase Asp1 isoform X2 n=1 Tax=Tarenaya hassleriana TaxID=28532 RepID=UPI00053C2D80|nr:PREDICTED: aspartic proteinase Asp1 isoform X2 [Tarenaya hassleriana]XP_010521266.1 PREDICTED: aspartic proteinase Asp1 isoform X2 [Tarenaya hassleriana]